MWGDISVSKTLEGGGGVIRRVVPVVLFCAILPAELNGTELLCDVDRLQR
jgi:hypothetical protein